MYEVRYLTSVLGQNLGILRNLVAGSAGARVNAAISKSNMNNMLMQLRKYVVSLSVMALD